MTMKIPGNAQGNAFVYILIAIALFGALTFALSGTEETAGVSDLSEGQSTIAANEILSYAAAAQNAITSLDRVGTGADELDFVLPSDDADFNTAPHVNKLFHPEGGGLSYKPLPRDAIVPDMVAPEAGYYIGRFSNNEWTPTNAEDVIFTAFGIKLDICQALNLKVLGAPAPIVSTDNIRDFLVDIEISGLGSNSGIDSATCPNCEEIPSACVTDGSGDYAFYSILVAR